MINFSIELHTTILGNITKRINDIMQNNIERLNLNFTLDLYTFSLTILYLITQIYPSQVLINILKFVVLLFIVFSLFSLRGSIAKIVYSLLFLSAIIVITTNNYKSVLDGALLNLPIVAIFTIAPLLGISVKIGDYIEALKVLLNRYRNNSLFFFVTYLLLTHLFSLLLNIGSVIINLQLMKSSNITSKRLIANSLSRGFNSIVLWSPYLGIMILVISLVEVEWSVLVVHTFGFIIITLIVAVLVEIPTMLQEDKRLQLANDTDDVITVSKQMKKSYWKDAIELFFLLVVTMGLILLLEKVTNFGIVMSIAIISLTFPFLWSVYKKKIPRFKEEFAAHVSHTVPNLKSELTLFIVAGIFGHLFVQSPYSDKVTIYLNAMFGNSPYFMLVALSTVIIITGIIGAHPAVMVTILAISIIPEDIGLTPLCMAALLLGSFGISNTVSPATAISNFLTYELNEKVYVITLRWNWLYALILYLLLPPYLLLLGL